MWPCGGVALVSCLHAWSCVSRTSFGIVEVMLSCLACVLAVDRLVPCCMHSLWVAQWGIDLFIGQASRAPSSWLRFICTYKYEISHSQLWPRGGLVEAMLSCLACLLGQASRAPSINCYRYRPRVAQITKCGFARRPDRANHMHMRKRYLHRFRTTTT